MAHNNDDIEKVVLPIRGYGLGASLVVISFRLKYSPSIEYEHKETPGLGGELTIQTGKVAER